MAPRVGRDRWHSRHISSKQPESERNLRPFIIDVRSINELNHLDGKQSRSKYMYKRVILLLKALSGTDMHQTQELWA